LCIKMFISVIYLTAKLLQFIGSVLLSGVTVYTLWSYRKIRPSLMRIRFYAYKRPLVLPKDYDEFIERLANVLAQLTGGRRVEFLLILTAAGFAMLTIGIILEFLIY